MIGCRETRTVCAQRALNTYFNAAVYSYTGVRQLHFANWNSAEFNASAACERAFAPLILLATITDRVLSDPGIQLECTGAQKLVFSMVLESAGLRAVKRVAALVFRRPVLAVLSAAQLARPMEIISLAAHTQQKA